MILVTHRRVHQRAQNWPFLAVGARSTLHAEATLDLVNLANGVVGALGLATGVIGVIAII